MAAPPNENEEEVELELRVRTFSFNGKASLFDHSGFHLYAVEVNAPVLNDYDVAEDEEKIETIFNKSKRRLRF